MRLWEICRQLVELRRDEGLEPRLPDRWLHLAVHLCRKAPDQEPHVIAVVTWTVISEVDGPRQG